MKTLHLAIIVAFLGFTGLMLSYDNTTYGIWVPQSPQELLKESSTIFVGNITSANVLQFEKGITYNMEENGIEKNIVKNYTLSLDEYKVNVEEFLKNPQNTNKMTVRQPITSWSPGILGGLDEFHVGDRVLFYIKNLDGNNTYSPESFIIPKYCAAQDVLTQKRLESRGESFIIQNSIKVDSNFTANKPIQFVDNEDVTTLSGKNLDTVVRITKNTGSSPEIVFSKEIHSEAKLCEWIASTEWEFTPQEGEYRMDVTITEDNKTYSQYVTKFSVKSDVVTSDHLSPLKQFKSGISALDVKCPSNYTLVIKSEDGSPVCVTSNTAQKLMERGWTMNPTGVSALAKPPVGIYNLTLSTNPIILGIPFYINAVVVNHQTEPITYYSGCTSPLSISFDSIKTSTGNVHCLAISKYTLEPNQSVPVQSDKIETLYNATRPNTTINAQIKFSYEEDGKPASIFTSMQIPIQTAIMIDCSTRVPLHISQIDKTVNVTKAIALAYTSPEFAAKVKQYGNVSYNYFQNDWFSSASCHTYWNGTEVMFTTNDKNGSRNIQVSEDINLTKVLKVKDFQVGLSK